MSQFTLPKLDRRKLKSVRMDLDEEDFALLVTLARTSGLRNKTRFLRWLIWLWKALEDTAWGKDDQDPWKAGEREPRVWLALVREVPGEPGKRVSRTLAELPDGWRKG